MDRDWVLLSYRVPREPSTPRIAIWRRLKQLGVLQLGDGLVALPRTAETLEQLEWVAQQVVEAEGDALVWTAQPTAAAEQERLVERLRRERAEEYAHLGAEIGEQRHPDRRTLNRWRRTLAQIERRDHLATPGADAVRAQLRRFASDRQEATQ